MKNSVNKALWILVFATASFKAIAQPSGTLYSEAQKTKKASLVLVHFESLGFATRQPNGNVEGLVIDIMKDFAQFAKQTEGIDVTYQFKSGDPENFKRFMTEVKEGKGGVFGLGNITITEARKKDYQFSPSFIKNISLLCTHKDVPTLESMEKAAVTFANFRGLAVAGSTDEKSLMDLKAKYIPTLKVERVNNNKEALDIIAKEKNAFTKLEFTYFLSAQQRSLPIKHHEVADESTEEYGIIMPKSNDWAPLLSRFLSTEYLKSSEYKKKLATHKLRKLETLSKNEN